MGETKHGNCFFYLVNIRTWQVLDNNTFLLLRLPQCCLQMTVARAQKEIFFSISCYVFFFMVTTDKSHESVCSRIYALWLCRGNKRHENVLSTLDTVCNIL